MDLNPGGQRRLANTRTGKAPRRLLDPTAVPTAPSWAWLLIFGLLCACAAPNPAAGQAVGTDASADTDAGVQTQDIAEAPDVPADLGPPQDIATTCPPHRVPLEIAGQVVDPCGCCAIAPDCTGYFGGSPINGECSVTFDAAPPCYKTWDKKGCEVLNCAGSCLTLPDLPDAAAPEVDAGPDAAAGLDAELDSNALPSDLGAMETSAEASDTAAMDSAAIDTEASDTAASDTAATDTAATDTVAGDTALPDAAIADTAPQDAGPCSWPDPYKSLSMGCNTSADCPAQAGMAAVCAWGPMGFCFSLPQACAPAAAATSACDDLADGTLDSCSGGVCSHTCLPEAKCDLGMDMSACDDQNPCTYDLCAEPLSLPGSGCYTCNHIPATGCCAKDSDCPPVPACWTSTCTKLPLDAVGMCTATNVCCK